MQRTICCNQQHLSNQTNNTATVEDRRHSSGVAKDITYVHDRSQNQSDSEGENGVYLAEVVGKAVVVVDDDDGLLLRGRAAVQVRHGRRRRGEGHGRRRPPGPSRQHAARETCGEGGSASIKSVNNAPNQARKGRAGRE